MKRPYLSICAGFILAHILFLAGCKESVDVVDTAWTPRTAISASTAGLGGAIVIHKFRNTLIGVQVHKGSVQVRELNPERKSWFQLSVSDAPRDYLWYGATIDAQVGTILVPQGYAENEQLVMKVLVGNITQNGVMRNTMERRWITDKKSLHGETGPNTSMNHLGYRYGPGLGRGILNGPEIYLPFTWSCKTTFGVNNVSNGPFANGVFRSSDSGKTWQLEKLSDFETWGPTMCKTAASYYYVGVRYPITRHGVWASRKPIFGNTWEQPTIIVKSFANVSGHYAVAGEDGTAHICWMDRRHNKWRFDLTGPPIENNDIYYRRRKDSDSEWGKEVHLSKGLLYCYAPTIAAEGDNVVVAWAGIRDAGKQHSDMGPNDIYFVTSKDGGVTWTKPLKVTDGAKDGSTAGMPQVAMLNGTIHLLYIQGTVQARTELSPGLTKLGLDPWPIYYTQRPFPK